MSGYEVNYPEYIVLHHSYLPGDDFEFNDWNSIRNWHINNNGWLDIGYQYGIEYVNGDVVIQKGRPENVNGAHCVGLNTKSIGICVIGNYDNSIPDDKMINALVSLIRDIYSRYGKLPIVKHSDYSDKTCPGLLFPVNEVISLVNAKQHWAEASYQNLISKGVNISERRFDDKITRGEAFALADKIMEVLI